MRWCTQVVDAGPKVQVPNSGQSPLETVEPFTRLVCAKSHPAIQRKKPATARSNSAVAPNCFRNSTA